MAQIYESTWWSIELPEGWTYASEAECSTFQATPPLGALQISSARKDGPIDESDLKEFAIARLGGTAHLRAIEYGPWSGFSAEREIQSRSWKEWWLRSGHTMLYATYNVPREYRHMELSAVESIVRSAKLRSIFSFPPKSGKNSRRTHR
jgi:hypothetical protein